MLIDNEANLVSSLGALNKWLIRRRQCKQMLIYSSNVLVRELTSIEGKVHSYL